ncbi:hypothetical protein ACLOJK_033015, partial [Asimina triloba]
MKADPAVDRDAPQSNGPAPPPTRPPPSAAHKTSTPASVDKLRTLPWIVGAKPNDDSATNDAAIEEIRERLLGHLRSAADKMRFRVPEEEKEESAVTPWLLQKKLLAGKAPMEIGATMTPPSPPVVQESRMRSMRSRTAAAAATAANAAAQGMEKPREKRKLSVALLKEEIEEDFFLMMGCRPAMRRKKRSRKVQRQLDLTFPGLWLFDITVKTYKIPESHETGKAPESITATEAEAFGRQVADKLIAPKGKPGKHKQSSSASKRSWG